MIRTATLDDAQALLDIYTPYVLNTTITFETEVRFCLATCSRRFFCSTGKCTFKLM